MSKPSINPQDLTQAMVPIINALVHLAHNSEGNVQRQYHKAAEAMEEAVLRTQTAAEGGTVKNRPIRQN